MKVEVCQRNPRVGFLDSYKIFVDGNFEDQYKEINNSIKNLLNDKLFQNVLEQNSLET